jgi:hypothetical protein
VQLCDTRRVHELPRVCTSCYACMSCCACSFVTLDVSTSLMSETAKLLLLGLIDHKHVSLHVLEWVRQWNPLARVAGIMLCAVPVPVCLHAWFGLPALLGLVGAFVCRSSLPLHSAGTKGKSRQSLRHAIVSGVADDNPVRGRKHSTQHPADSVYGAAICRW